MLRKTQSQYAQWFGLLKTINYLPDSDKRVTFGDLDLTILYILIYVNKLKMIEKMKVTGK